MDAINKDGTINYLFVSPKKNSQSKTAINYLLSF